MDSRKVQERLLKNNQSIKTAYDAGTLRHKIARLLIRGRVAKGLTQRELAEKVGTKQPAIARIENAAMLPSLGFLEKIAHALNTELIEPNFKFLKDVSVTTSNSTQTQAPHTMSVKDMIIVRSDANLKKEIPYA